MAGLLGWIVFLTCGGVGSGGSSFAQELPRLKVSDNRRFLVTDQGKPFFWLGDTAWELFHRLNREEAVKYLDHRAAHGFTVIQAVALAELGGLSDPNPYGHKPLVESDPERPDVRPGPEDDYWDHVDFIIDQANRRGMYIGLLPTWGDKWNQKWGKGPEIFNPANAKIYGEWIAQRYKDRGVVWILGGDRPIESDYHQEINRSMAAGIRAGSEGKQLITWHPTGGNGSSQYFHEDEWLDFNMRQNGHSPEYTSGYEGTSNDYQRKPIKPVLMENPSMKIIRFLSMPRNLAIRWLRMFADRCIGICSWEPLDIPTAIIRYGRCGRTIARRPIIHSCLGIRLWNNLVHCK